MSLIFQAYVPYAVLLRQHEEAQKLKKVLDTKVTGTVKWFSLRYHYGFIARDDGKGDVFVHQMNIIKSRMKRVYLRSLAHGETVEFDVVEGKLGAEASNVTGPDGTDVQGVYVIQLRYPIRTSNSGRGSRRRDSTGDIGTKRRTRRRVTDADDDKSPASSPSRRGNRKLDDDSDSKKSSSEPSSQEKRRRNNRNRQRKRTTSASKSGKRDASEQNNEQIEKMVADLLEERGTARAAAEAEAKAKADQKNAQPVVAVC